MRKKNDKGSKRRLTLPRATNSSFLIFTLLCKLLQKYNAIIIRTIAIVVLTFVYAPFLYGWKTIRTENPEYKKLLSQKIKLKEKIAELGESIGKREEMIQAAEEYADQKKNGAQGSDLEDILYGVGGLSAILDKLFGTTEQELKEKIKEYEEVSYKLSITPPYIERKVKEPPNIPAIPSGPSQVTIGSTIIFSTVISDPDNDWVSYQFDFGDGTLSDWSKYCPSYSAVEIQHAFLEEGKYQVRVRARDQDGNISPFSTPIEVQVMEK